MRSNRPHKFTAQYSHSTLQETLDRRASLRSEKRDKGSKDQEPCATHVSKRAPAFVNRRYAYL